MTLMQFTLEKARSVALRGQRYQCPICEGRFTYFLPFEGIFPSENGICPGCGSMPRQRALWLLLLDLAKKGEIRLAGRMLHVAPERCLTRRFRKMFDYVSVDLDGAKAMRAGDITDLREFDNNTFDAIVCNHVLEHVVEDRKAMAELYRVLRPDGWASLQVPWRHDAPTDEDSNVTDPSERERRWQQWNHVRLYGYDYSERLEAAGFRVKMSRWEEFVALEKARFHVANSLDMMIMAWK